MRLTLSAAIRFSALALILALLNACGAPATGDSPAASQTAANDSAVAESPQADPTAAPAPTKTPEPTATPAPAEPGLSRSNPLPLGTEARFKTWAITVKDVTRGEAANAAIAAANQFNEPPRDGHEYVLLGVDVTNIGEEQEAQDPSFGVDVRVTGERNVLYSRASVVTPQRFEGQLFPGGTASGQLAFEVPLGETNLLAYVAESLSFDNNARFVAVEDGARVEVDPALDSIASNDVGKTRNAPARPGETAIAEDWEVTVLESLRGTEAASRVAEANMFNDPAPAGQEYVLARLRVRYIGADEPDAYQNVSSSFVRLTGEQNVVYDSPFAVAPSPTLDANLFPGGETEGWVALSAAEGEGGLVLIFKPLFSFGDANTRFLALE